MGDMEGLRGAMEGLRGDRKGGGLGNYADVL